MANWADRLAKWAQALAADGSRAIESLPTAETDDTLVLAPDGTGGVEFRAEAGGGAAALQAAKYVRTSGNYGTTSTSFVDVDATNMALTITTGARRVMVGLVGTCGGTNLGNTLFFDVDMDGTRLSGASFGLMQTRTPVAGYRMNGSFTYLTDVLTAASHTFKLQWFINANTAVLYGTASGDGVATFWVQEVY